MTTQKRQDRIRTERRNIIRKKQIAKRRIFLLLSAVFVITLGSIVYGSIFSSAKDESKDTQQYKYYKSIEIQAGDSLWTIAEEYCDESYDGDIQQYIKELKELNSLKSEKIHAGRKLLVFYYDTEIHY